ncbi:CynX/NimT family MFS transporter [Radiobacillus sp. PE A8.2]|uniref:CynX/NimT family MFS transporter n=1 Tax=Radiobacillus sp. PE A8.2 TaxID=3380349 RepID=UPI003890D52A
MNSLKTSSTSFRSILFIIGIIFIAFNLRPAITSVGPLIGTIRDSIGLSNWNVGLITSLPLLAFAIMSPLAPKLANKFNNQRSLLLGLSILVAGICIRSIAFTITLYLGTTLIGIGIAICNVLLPGVIKEKFPTKVGFMTSIYTTSMSIFAATASGLSIPLSQGLGLGWQKALGSWAILATIGLIIWIIIVNKDDQQLDNQLFEPSATKLLASPLAWQVTLFMGVQSFLFYTTISWLPEILQTGDITKATAGWLLSYMQFISLPATFLTPILAGRFRNQQGIVVLIGSCALLGYSGLFISDSLWLNMISITFIGLALGASISLSLTFLGMRADNARQAAELSGMAQSFGYLLAATGPILIGFLYDISGNWKLPLFTILIFSSLIVVFGLGAGRNKKVLD